MGAVMLKRDWGNVYPCTLYNQSDQLVQNVFLSLLTVSQCLMLTDRILLQYRHAVNNRHHCQLIQQLS